MVDRDETTLELQSLLAQIRSAIPGVVITTRLAHADAVSTIVHAQIVGGGDVAIGVHAGALSGEGGVELAENRAILRAMIALGMTPFNTDDGPRLRSVPDGESGTRVVQFRKPESEKSERPEQSIPANPTIEDDPADISWTAFWRWARGAGYPDKQSIEAEIGRSIDDLAPSQIRSLLVVE